MLYVLFVLRRAPVFCEWWHPASGGQIRSAPRKKKTRALAVKQEARQVSDVHQQSQFLPQATNCLRTSKKIFFLIKGSIGIITFYVGVLKQIVASHHM